MRFTLFGVVLCTGSAWEYSHSCIYMAISSFQRLLSLRSLFRGPGLVGGAFNGRAGLAAPVNGESRSNWQQCPSTFELGDDDPGSRRGAAATIRFGRFG